MKRQIVILRITYDELQNDQPVQWNWPLLLDVGGAENVEVIGATPTEKITDENPENEEDDN